MGSVYVFHTSDQIDDGAWRDSLRHLETYGVGDRRVEGYGEVRVCDEFHQEIQEVEVK
jgi:CRISPR-associated protein Csx10